MPGPYTSDHGYIQWGGALPGGEIWSCGLRVASVGGIGSPSAATDSWNMKALLDHYTVAIKAMHANSLTQISNRCILQWVKFNRVAGDTGLYKDPVSWANYFPDVLGGGSSSGPHPPNQICIAITTTTDVSRGPAARGRFFLPMPIVAIGVDGLIPTAVILSMKVPLRTMIELMGDVPGVDVAADPSPVVMSRKAGSPATRKITGIKLGRVLDTQRRRRNALKENYMLEPIDQGTF